MNELQFITKNKTVLYEGSHEFRFISFNTPNLAVNEDPFWHRCTKWEQTDLLNSIAQFNGKVIRIYPFSIHKNNPSHFEFNPKNVSWALNSQLFEDLDQALVLANQRNIRVIIPLIDIWDWWGGIPTMTRLLNNSSLDFYSDPAMRSLYKDLTYKVISRKNSITGIPYNQDPTILAWETGNELSWNQKYPVPGEWTLDICKFIRLNDPNHLIMDGSFGIYGWDSQVLNDSCIDILSNHYYIGNFQSFQLGTLFDVLFLCGITIGCLFLTKKWKDEAKSYKYPLVLVILCSLFTISYLTFKLLSGSLYALQNQFQKDLLLAQQYNKSFIIGEFGLTSLYPMQLLLSKFIESTASGALLWSLRGQSESGGFCIFFIFNSHSSKLYRYTSRNAWILFLSLSWISFCIKWIWK